jgi:adenosine deaminase
LILKFQNALETGNLDALRRCPKSDLHNHAILGGHRAFILNRTGGDIAPLNRKLRSIAEMHTWADQNVGGMFSSREGRLLGFEATLVQGKEDGVTRLEIGEDVWASTLFHNSAQELTRELARLHALVASEIDWIPQIGLSRHCSIAALQRWLEPFLALDFYRTIDLSGDEFAQPIERFKPLYRMAKACGLRLKAHVGEWGTADDVCRAVEQLELDEVQHGIAAAESPAVMRFLADHRVQLNLCPTSNVMLGRVERIELHPIRPLYDAGVRVTINTDDALVFGCSVSQEFLSLHKAGVFASMELDQIRLNGLTDF